MTCQRILKITNLMYVYLTTEAKSTLYPYLSMLWSSTDKEQFQEEGECILT